MHTLGKPELSENRTIRPVPRQSGSESLLYPSVPGSRFNPVNIPMGTTYPSVPAVTPFL
ncbi:hypothetical protein DPMN_069705 [Dreissena polymorpha]|uniref:Uncharacterized protein n=1 Tax=Dreissena polymorpha TaxID=45954 RepID=A0A9D3Z4U1_DREPO|nr:hypothetical protein DPMN_069705 [Dreissena polymorpha]